MQNLLLPRGLIKPTRRSFIAGAAAVIASPAIVRAQLPTLGVGGGFGPAAGGGFTPGSLTNLVAWYKADTGVTTSSGNVTAVADQSGNGYNLANTNTVPFNATSGYNSKPAFDFQSGNDGALSATVSLPNVQNLSVFLVCRLAASANSGFCSLATGPGNDYNDTTPAAIRVFNKADDVTLQTYCGTLDITATVASNTNYRLGLVSTFGVGGTMYINNVSSGTDTGYLAALALTTPTKLIIGNRYQGGVIGGSSFGGPILEIVVAASAVGSTDRNSLDTYFTTKWGT